MASAKNPTEYMLCLLEPLEQNVIHCRRCFCSVLIERIPSKCRCPPSSIEQCARARLSATLGRCALGHCVHVQCPCHCIRPILVTERSTHSQQNGRLARPDLLTRFSLQPIFMLNFARTTQQRTVIDSAHYICLIRSGCWLRTCTSLLVCECDTFAKVEETR